MDLLEKLFTIIRGLFEKNRATSIGDVYGQVWERLYEVDPDAWLTDLYVDEASGQMFAVAAKGGKLYRADVSSSADGFSIGEMQEVVHEFRPVESRSRLRVKREAGGAVRWFAFPACTAVMDRVGEIDSTALFDSFVAALERSGSYPYLTFYHQGETLRMGQADFVARDGYALLMSGVFDDTALARAAAAAIERDGEYWGTSIGYAATQPPEMMQVGDGITIPVYTEGVLREVSILPEADAAALFTSLATVERGDKPMRKEVLEALKKLVGDDEDLVKELSERTDAVNRTAEADNLIRRETEETAVEETATQTDQLELDDAAIAAVADQVKPTLEDQVMAALAPINAAIEALQAAIAGVPATIEASRAMIEGINTRLAEIEKTEEEKRAAWQADLPARRSVTATYRPRTAPVVDNGGKPPLADVAAETLSKIKK